MITHRINSHFRVQIEEELYDASPLFEVNACSKYITPAECKRLRDALIELYPLEERVPLWEQDK